MARRCALLVVVALMLGSGVALAQSNNCGRVGTWFGQGDSGITWIAGDNPGTSATVGQVALEWVLMDPTLGGFFPDAVRVTNARGVWEKVNQNKYKYTWVAYAFDGAGQPVFVARASGDATMAGCDTVNITYALALFSPGQKIWSDTPEYGTFPGTALETRMPMVK
jgi:hypothetical protein